MLNLNDLRFFVAAVEAGGFASASRIMGVPKATVSKRVAELEAALSVRLIHRTSRSFTLTEIGREFHQHARAALIEAEAAQSVIATRKSEPSGTVRITTSVPTGQMLANHLPRLAVMFPKLLLQLDISDRFIDIVQEGYDIALRSHSGPLPDSGLVQRQVLVETIALVASPKYLSEHSTPTDPADLPDHHGLLTDRIHGTWNLQAMDGRNEQAAPMPRMIANESSVLLSAAQSGLGIACLPISMCRSALLRGELVRVLDGWAAGSITTTLILPHRRGELPGVRAAAEFLVACLRGHTDELNSDPAMNAGRLIQ